MECRGIGQRLLDERLIVPQADAVDAGKIGREPRKFGIVDDVADGIGRPRQQHQLQKHIVVGVFAVTGGLAVERLAATQRGRLVDGRTPLVEFRGVQEAWYMKEAVSAVSFGFFAS